MTKAELVEAVAEAAGVSKADAERTIGAYWDTVIGVVKAGGKLYAARKGVKVTIGGCGG